jgi:hypothetical protein
VGGETAVAGGVGFVGRDGELFAENGGGIEAEGDAQLGGEMFVGGVGAERDAAGGGSGGGGEGDLEPVAAGGGGDDEVGREGRNESLETGEFGGGGVGALAERIEGRGEILGAGGEEDREIEISGADEDAEASGGPRGAESAQGGGEEDEVAERVEFEEERGARRWAGHGRGHGAAGASSTWSRRPVRRRVSGAGSGKSAGAERRTVRGVTEAGIRTRRLA